MRRVPIQVNAPESGAEIIKCRSRSRSLSDPHDIEKGNLISVDESRKANTGTPVARLVCLCCYNQNKFRLCSSHEVPLWMARKHILTGYRPDMSFYQCIGSIGFLHNETGNIWTHLVGCGVVVYLMFHLHDDEEDYEHHHNLTKVPLSLSSQLIPYKELSIQCFLFAAAICLFLSSIYHAGNCCQKETTCTMLLRADISGIAMLIASSFVPGVYFGFACFPELQRIYLYLTSVLLVMGLSVSFADYWIISSNNEPNKALLETDSISDMDNLEAMPETSQQIRRRNSDGDYRYENMTFDEKYEKLLNKYHQNKISNHGIIKNDEKSELRKDAVAVLNQNENDEEDAEELGANLTMNEKIKQEENNKFSRGVDGEYIHRLRTTTFIGLVSLGVVLAIHWMLIVADEARQTLFPKFCLMIGCYGVGFGFYALHIPEKWMPGTFDYIFHSHQIWHLFVVMAILVWLNGSMDVASLLNNQGCTAFVHPDLIHVVSNATFIQDMQDLMAADGYAHLNSVPQLRGSAK